MELLKDLIGTQRCQRHRKINSRALFVRKDSTSTRLTGLLLVFFVDAEYKGGISSTPPADLKVLTVDF